MWWTVAAAIIASATALSVAFLAYPVQKTLDREASHKEHLRQLYSDYLSQLLRQINAQPFKNEPNVREKVEVFFTISPGETELYILRDQIVLLAPSHIIDAVIKCDQAFRDWKIQFTSEFENVDEAQSRISASFETLNWARQDLLVQMRNDISSHSSLRFKENTPRWLRRASSCLKQIWGRIT